MLISRQARQGFTLVEILIAIAIIAIIGAIVTPGYMAYRRRAAKKATIASLGALQTAIQSYEEDVTDYPTNLRNLIERPKGEAGKRWDGSYLGKKLLPRDGYGTPFKYKRTKGGKNPYNLYSFGPNKQGAPKSEWISVWDF